MDESHENLERRGRILDAAERLVLHYGYDKTTVSDIAQEAGVSKGAIYLHFSSKEDLFDALILRDARRYVSRIVELMEADESEWSFASMFSMSIIALDENPVMRAVGRSDPKILGAFLQRSGLDLMAYKQQSRYPLLKMMQDAGALRQDIDMKTAAYILGTMNYGMLYASEIMPPEDIPTTEQIIEGTADLLERFLVPPDGGNREAGKRIMIDIIRAYQAQINNETSADQTRSKE